MQMSFKGLKIGNGTIHRKPMNYLLKHWEKKNIVFNKVEASASEMK